MCDPQPFENITPKVPQSLVNRPLSAAWAQRRRIIEFAGLVVGCQSLGCGFAEDTARAFPCIVCLTVQLPPEFGHKEVS
jgi:hypothetical protein